MKGLNKSLVKSGQAEFSEAIFDRVGKYCASHAISSGICDGNNAGISDRILLILN